MAMERLPDKVLLAIFSFLGDHREILKCATVCKKWRGITSDSRLWQCVSLRPDFNGLNVLDIDKLITLISVRFGPSIRLMELPMELIQVPIIHELAGKCPKLQYLTLDFSNAMQLHDFTDMNTFPPRLRSLTICLSEVIFLEGFMRKIYSFISSIEVLHLIGTYEKIEDEEPEVYEVVNIQKLKAFIPNIRVVNLWGVVYVTDEHLESLSSNAAHLECLQISYCQKVRGGSLKALLGRCKKLRSLLMDHVCMMTAKYLSVAQRTSSPFHLVLDSKTVIQVPWESSSIEELNITATELSQECLVSILSRLPNLRYLSAGFLESFTDKALEQWMESGTCKNLRCLDLDTCDSLTDSVLTTFIQQYGGQIEGLILGGIPHLLENFWLHSIPKLKEIRTLVMGVQEDCCPKVLSKITIDPIMDTIATNCPKVKEIEARWESDTLRFSDKSSKFIDILRAKCKRLDTLILRDGRYFEMAKANYLRADRETVARQLSCNRLSLVPFLAKYHDLMFN